MDGEISSDMPGVEEFQDIPEQELGDQLPNQDAAGRGQQQGQTQQGTGARRETATGQQGAAEAAAPVLEPSASDSVKTLEAKLAKVETALSTMTRENRAYQALNSKVARLENALKQRETSQTQALSPEQQVQADQKAEAEKFLRDFLGEHVPDIIKEKYGNIIETIERQDFQYKQDSFKASVEGLCKEQGIPFGEIDPIFGKLLAEDTAAYESDPAAKARIDRILNGWDPYELFFRAQAERSKQLQATGATVKKAQSAAADKGGRAFKPNGAKPTQEGKRTLADIEAMSEEDREKIPMEELEALIPRQRQR